MTENVQQRLYQALRIISKFDSLEYLRHHSQKAYGLEYPEALEMSYENIIDIAKEAIRGVKSPISPPRPQKSA